LFSAYFSIPESKKVTIMGHGAFDIEQRDYDANHYDAHITIRMIRVTVKREIRVHEQSQMVAAMYLSPSG